MANKLLRAFAMQAEALAKLKRGGEQTVRVEHFHVHEGAQAIIGAVQGGGGGIDEKSRQAHALALPSPDPERRAMPIIASDGKEALPHGTGEHTGAERQAVSAMACIGTGAIRESRWSYGGWCGCWWGDHAKQPQPFDDPAVPEQSWRQ
jgi:hypothetical protein